MQALFKNKYLLLLLFGLTTSIIMVSCDKDEPDKVDANKIELLSFGPSQHCEVPICNLLVETWIKLLKLYYLPM